MADESSTGSPIATVPRVATALESVAIGAGLVAVYAVTAVLGSRLVGFGPPHPDPAAGLILPFAMLFGVVGVIAGGIGVIVRDVLLGGTGTWTVAVTVTHLFAGYVCLRLGRAQLTGLRPSTNTVVRLGAITVLTAVAAGAMVGWTGEVLAIAPFFLAGITTAGYLIVLVIVGVPVLVLGHRFVPVRSTEVTGVRPVFLLGAVLIGWLILGIVGSIGYYNLDRVPGWLLVDAGLGPLLPILEHPAIGRGAVNVQTAIAAIAIGATVALTARMPGGGSPWT